MTSHDSEQEVHQEGQQQSTEKSGMGEERSNLQQKIHKVNRAVHCAYLSNSFTSPASMAVPISDYCATEAKEIYLFFIHSKEVYKTHHCACGQMQMPQLSWCTDQFRHEKKAACTPCGSKMIAA